MNLTAEDCNNIAKWISAAAAASKMNMRGPLDESEQRTWKKITMHALRLRIKKVSE